LILWSFQNKNKPTLYKRKSKKKTNKMDSSATREYVDQTTVDVQWPKLGDGIGLFPKGKSYTGKYRKLEIQKPSDTPSGPICTNEKDPITLEEFSEMANGTELMQRMDGNKGYECTGKEEFANWLSRKDTDPSINTKIENEEDRIFLGGRSVGEQEDQERETERNQTRLQEEVERQFSEMADSPETEAMRGFIRTDREGLAVLGEIRGLKIQLREQQGGDVNVLRELQDEINEAEEHMKRRFKLYLQMRDSRERARLYGYNR
jgi:hypothetical protein